jgi:predicted DNA-binding transcriptional regulator AlpA
MQASALANADAVEVPTVGPGLLFSASDLAEILRVSKPTIWRLRAAGKLPRPLDALGSQLLRWDADEIRRWIAAKMPDLETWTELNRT